MKTLLIILGCGTTHLFSYAQTAQKQYVGFPTPSLIIEKVGINVTIPTESIIDLRDLLDTPISNLSVLTASNDDKTFQLLDEEAISKYKLNNDSLWLYEKETPLTRLVYSKPELKLTFPLKEGSHTIGLASGKGYYADKLAFMFHTTYETSVFPSNEIVMPDGSKKNNVYRVKTTRSTSYSGFASDSIGSTTREEENFWYLQGELFPILSAYEITNDEKSYKGSYYAREKFANENANPVFSTSEDKEGQNTIPPLEYKVTKHEGSREIKITYSSKNKINVTFTVVSIGGITYQNQRNMASPDAKYTYHYNYSHLPRGEYAVKIGVANQQFSVKFNVK